MIAGLPSAGLSFTSTVLAARLSLTKVRVVLNVAVDTEVGKSR